MKKTSLLRILCSVFSVVLLMSSCLGDGDSSFTVERDFAYIVSGDVGPGKYAITPNGYIVSDVITKLQTGKCYYIGYKVTNTTAEGFYQAEYVNVLNNGNPIPDAEFSLLPPYSGIPVRNDTITPTNLAIKLWSGSQHAIGDRWLVDYNMTKKENDEVKAYFYFDRNNQKDSEGEIKPGDNKIIIDIRFAFIKNTGETNVTDVFSTVGNLGGVRTNYTPDYTKGEEKYVNVPVKFRYQKYTTAGQPAEVVYIGSWNLNSSSNVYYLQFEKP
ncbi:hypothetical protein [Prevotella sp. 10(H)]|uniref:hypothetical protein n=1 Tax=Prevotella sp. 10(H) TaxID=1158294 RepID=UPI000AA557C5|nr:hypothetical protein [Prevotella sp. 10(H)]